MHIENQPIQQKTITNELWPGQLRLIKEYKASAIGVVAGYGYGKTTFGVCWHFNRVLINKESAVSLVVAADYKLVKTVCMPAYEHYLTSLGLVIGKHFSLNKAENILYFPWSGQKVIFLTAEKPKKIAAYNASHAWFDEAARCDEEVNENLVARIRCPKAKVHQICYTTTPEGTNWLYDLFHPESLQRTGRHSVGASKIVLHGASTDNRMLPASYFQTLRDTYGWESAMYRNYVLGEWTNLNQNSFYFSFNEREHVIDYELNKDLKRLVLTWDNNVGQMTWVTVQPTAEGWATHLDNDCSGRNIEHACQQFMDKYPPHLFKDWHIEVYGDAALHARSVQSYTTGYEMIEALLKPHYPRLQVLAHRGNPMVNERSMCTNRLFALKRLAIGKKCRKVIQSAREAESDKKTGIKKGSGDRITHAMEALDMALICIDPPPIRPEAHGVSW